MAVYSCLVESCSENIWKISRSMSASDCKFRNTKDWLNPHND